MPDRPPIIRTATVRVRDLSVLADVGINPDEVGRRQPLIVSVELTIDADGNLAAIDGTVDYRRIVGAVEALAARHVPLIEAFGERLCTTFIGWRNVRSARVNIDKPFALTRGLAGVEISAQRETSGWPMSGLAGRDAIVHSLEHPGLDADRAETCSHDR